MKHKQKSQEMSAAEIETAFGNIRKNLEAIVEREKGKGEKEQANGNNHQGKK